MSWLANVTGGYSSSARVVGETLVLSLPDARAPVVWRMELGSVKAAAFEIKEQEGAWQLIMKTPDGKVQEIAPFDSKTRAVKALMAASRAMEQAARFPANDAGSKAAVAAVPQKARGGILIGIVLGILILAGLLLTMAQIGPRSSQLAGVAGGMAAAGQAGSGTAGVPVSADDFLMQR